MSALSDKLETLLTWLRSPVKATTVPKFRIARLNLRRHDSIVLKAEDRISEEQREHLRAALSAEFPGHRCIILDGGLELAVLRKQEREAGEAE